MSVINRLVDRDIRLNKRKSLAVILTVSLATALITMVISFLTTIQESGLRDHIRYSGNYHLRIMGVKEDLKERLKVNRDIDDFVEMTLVGYSRLDELEDEPGRSYLSIRSFDPADQEKLDFKILQGRFPENDREVLVPESFDSRCQHSYAIGDVLPCSVGPMEDHLRDGELYDDRDFIVDTEDRDYTIVGVYQAPINLVELVDEGYTSGISLITRANSGIWDNLYLQYKNPADYREVTAQIFGWDTFPDDSFAPDYSVWVLPPPDGIRSDQFKHAELNIGLIQWQSDPIPTREIKIFILSLLSIVCLAGLLMIRYSFSIYMLDKRRILAGLKGLGATEKQLRRFVIREGMGLALIGIMLGLAYGLLILYLLCQGMNAVITSQTIGTDPGLVYSVKWLALLVIVGLSSLIAYLSIVHLAGRMKRTPPIRLLRDLDQSEKRKETMKIPSWVIKRFKAPGLVAYINKQRSGKRGRILIFSISLSLFLFISISSLMGLIYDGFVLKNELSVDLQVTLEGGVEEKLLQEIGELPGIDSLSWIQRDLPGYDFIGRESVLTEEGRQLMNFSQPYPDGSLKNPEIELVYVDELTFRKVCDQLGLDEDQIQGEAIFIDRLTEGVDGAEESVFLFHEGDRIEIDREGERISFSLGAITDREPDILHYNPITEAPVFLLSADRLNLSWKPNILLINSRESDRVEEEISRMNPFFGIINYKENKQRNQQIIKTFGMVLYSLLALISLIGLANIYNAVESSMKARQQEFAIYRSIGMSPGQLKRSIFLETLYNAIISLILGLVLGSLLSIILVHLMGNTSTAPLSLPVFPILISVAVVFLLILLIQQYSIRQISKKNIIDTIRMENI